MELEGFRERLEAARALAAEQRHELVEILATNVDLRRESGEAFARQSAHERRQVGGSPPDSPADEQR